MDNFVVSARKYRPVTFDSVVGQKAITSTLRNAIRTNTLAQAFFFCGPRGVGKTTCARIMAKTINCLNPTPDMEACDECESCKAFNNSNSFNIYELDAASNNSVEDIRNLVDQVRIPPQVGKYKVYIIDEVHMLSQAAFNAFLKTLEEPPAYAKFIMATTEKHKILATILSRCQIFDFKRITVEDISKHLETIAEKENVVAEKDALNIIAQKADGALRDALSIFDQMVSFSGNTITYKDVIENLNVLDYEYYFQMLDHILAKDVNSILLLLNEVVDKGFDIQHFIQGLASHLRNLLLGRNQAVIDLMEVSQQLKMRYVQQAQRCSQYFILKALDFANQCDLNFKNSSNKRLHLEICLMKMCYIEQTGVQQQTQVQQQVVRPQQTKMQTQTPVQTQTQAPTPTPTMTQTRTPIPSPSPTSTPQSPTPTPQRMGRLNRAATISITADEPKAEKEEEERLDNDFTQEQLTKAWNDFVQICQSKSPAFAAGIKNAEPKKVSKSEVKFKIDNILVVKNQDNMQTLHEYLKKELRNNQFLLKEEVVERVHETVLYTDRQKFEKMINDNPNVLEIKNALGLQIGV